MKTKTTFVYLFVCLTGTAQVSQKNPTAYYLKESALCGGMDSILSRKGIWQKTGDATPFPDKTFPRNQYDQLYSRLDKMLPLLQEALPDLSGLEPRWYRIVNGQSFIPNGPVPYEFSSLYFTYYCNTNLKKILLDGETGTWAYVFVNQYNWFCQKIDDWDIKGDGKKITVYALPPKAGEWKGRTLYAPPTHAPNTRAVVLGHDGKLPWRSLTQKEYLKGLKGYWEEEKKKVLFSFDETEEKMKAQKLPANLSPEIAAKIKEQQEKQLKDYQRKKEERKTASAKFYDEEIRFMDEYLATASTETLETPAVVDGRNPKKFRGTFADENNGGSRVIAFSSKYFNNNLPRYVPQFVILYWRWTEDPVSLIFKKQFEENFPLEKLKAMIDK